MTREQRQREKKIVRFLNKTYISPFTLKSTENKKFVIEYLWTTGLESFASTDRYIDDKFHLKMNRKSKRQTK